MSEATTRGLRVIAESCYEVERSSPRDGEYFFSYTVRIANLGDRAVRLLSRLWIITDENGDEQRVEGPGVVGEAPVLEPGEDFEYQSFCPLRCPFGTMQGHYVMVVVETGERFEARIAPFALAAPNAVN